MYKIIHGRSPTMMKTISQLPTNSRELRNKNPFQTNNVHSVLNGTIRGSKIWVSVPEIKREGPNKCCGQQNVEHPNIGQHFLA